MKSRLKGANALLKLKIDAAKKTYRQLALTHCALVKTTEDLEIIKKNHNAAMEAAIELGVKEFDLSEENVVQMIFETST